MRTRNPVPFQDSPDLPSEEILREVAVRNFYQLYLENNLFKVRSAASASEALRLLDQEPVSLAVIDVYLGNESGIDLLRRIRAFVPLSRLLL